MFEGNVTCLIDVLTREVSVYGQNVKDDNFIGDRIQKALCDGWFFYDGRLRDALAEFAAHGYRLLVKPHNEKASELTIDDVFASSAKGTLPAYKS